MPAIIMQNLSTIIISLILAMIIAVIIVYLIKNKKNGRSSCGCTCQSCPMSGSCHQKK